MWRSGYLMCPNCGNVYYTNMLKAQPCGKSFEYYCPNYNCLGAYLFTIDELMIPAVKKLNDLGYKTRFCCSGHNRNIVVEREGRTIQERGYIYFVTPPETCPVGWEFDENHPDTIRSICDSLAWSIQNLEDWVEKLEPIA